jgi:signal transduction histidine kinase
VSNFHHFQGGFNGEISLRNSNVFESELVLKLAFDLFLIGALVITGLYYMGVFGLRTEERSPLYFGLFCLIMSLRTSFLNSNFFMMALPDFDWELFHRMDFLTLAISPLLFSAYMRNLYPREFSKKILNGVFTVSLVFSLLTVFLSVYRLTGLLTYYQLLILFVCFYVIFTLVMAAIHRQNGAEEMLLGCTILVATVINDILNAQSVINTGYIAGYGLLAFFFSQSYVISRVFIKALRTSVVLSRNLEIEVNDQTSEIRDLLDNTGQGILSFDSSMTINQHTSKSTFYIFGKAVSGENILELMFPEEKAEIVGYLEIIFQSNGKLKLVKDLLPTEYCRNNRYYHISFRWIPPGKKTPARVMVVLTDVTIKRKLEKMLEKDEQRNQKIIQIAVDRHGFLGFYNNIQKHLADIKSCLKRETEAIDIVKIARDLHTIKGGLAGYSFFEVAAIAHQAESMMEKVMNGQETLLQQHIDSLLSYTDKLATKFEESIVELGDLVPKQFLSIGNMPFYRISEEKIESLEHFLQDKLPDNPELDQMMTDLRKQPVRNLVKKVASDAKNIAFQLGKQIEVEYSGEDIKIIHAPLNGFFSTLIHLVRNAVDHGIEHPVERTKLGKPETGRLAIDITLQNRIFKFVFADDGRGLNVNELKNQALEKGLLTPEQALLLDDDEARLLIFKPGLTTRKELTGLSGRGLGMNAVAESVKELGGTITINSQPGKGTVFSFSIPVSF